jgi:adenylylsulfate kinase
LNSLNNHSSGRRINGTNHYRLASREESERLNGQWRYARRPKNKPCFSTKKSINLGAAWMIHVSHKQGIPMSAISLLHRPCVIWFTGLSGAGKTTTAATLLQALQQRSLPCYLLGGDELRKGLCSGLGFSESDREENVRRIGEAARLFMDAGMITLVAVIAPMRHMREKVRARFTDGDYLEVFVDAPLSVCEARDIKGLYKKSRTGSLKNFTGVDSRYEAPLAPDIHLKTADTSIDGNIDQLLKVLAERKIILQ